MTIRVGWLSPLTPDSGVGTFTHFVTAGFPTEINGEQIDLSLLYVHSDRLYTSDRRLIQLHDWAGFENILSLFDVLIYNIGNNAKNHHTIFQLLRRAPGIVICHDYTYQHYIAGECVERRQSPWAYAALSAKYKGEEAIDIITSSRITSRLHSPIFGPWDTDYAQTASFCEPFVRLGSAVIVHSKFAYDEVSRVFSGPIWQLSMPFDQKHHVFDDDHKFSLSHRTQINLVSFGHIGRNKCLEEVLIAIGQSEWLKENTRFTIAGFPSDEHYLSRLRLAVSEQHLENVVSFELSISEERLAKISSMADMFINLRYPNTEGASVSLVEQLNTGKPVLVYNTGCYSELPDNAAVKIDEIRSSLAIKLALENALSDRKKLKAIGRNGREYARRMDCMTYAQKLIGEYLANRDLLTRRSAFVSSGYVRRPLKEKAISGKDPWICQLAGTRFTLDLLDKGHATVDPTIIRNVSQELLGKYIATVIFGIDWTTELADCLSDMFKEKSFSCKYWTCVYLQMLVNAVFDGDNVATDKLRNLAPVTDVALLRLLSKLPDQVFSSALSLAILGRIVALDISASTRIDFVATIGESLSSMANEAGIDATAYAERVAVALESLVVLREELEEIAENDPSRATVIVTADKGSEIVVADDQHIRLRNFYRPEPTGAWTRGCYGYIHLKLANDATFVDVEILSGFNIAPQSRIIELTIDGSELKSTIEMRNAEIATLRVALPDAANFCEGITLKLSTSYATSPASALGSTDRRSLGVMLRKINIS